ncbi:SIR2 family protein [uncultured Tateyamaria sp.]|uniref:SIR2 family NAD-dependent protein deacylase n=1 Tax=uncultured Tateyamaria sp. TaxID=455651 RepID=UPI002624458A|nr:SIR2 family protein [uncultured Tateyamaria sp.]
MVDDLKNAISEQRVILFAGAGVSATLGAPTWGELIDHIGTELGYEPEVFRALSTNYLTLAEYYKLERGTIGPLRSWMDKGWNFEDSKIQGSAVHRLIAELSFPKIYTTNYDSNIERAFELAGKNVRKIVDVRDFLSVEQSDHQVIKLHGDFDSDESIVLTETDYFNRLSFESPLDIRLRSDVLANPVLFIGYSLSDINVRMLLHRLWEMWDSSAHQAHKPDSYIFLPRPNPIEERVLQKWGVKTIVGDDPDPMKSLEKFLEKLCD